MVAGRHAWLWGVMCGCGGSCVVVGGDMCGCGGHACLRGDVHGCKGVCVVAGGCMCSCGGACVGYDEIRSMSGRYASYWNAFLLRLSLVYF